MTTPAAFDRCPDARSGWRAGGNPEFAVIETHLSRRFVQTCDNRTHYAVDVIGGGRSSAIMRKMSAKTLRGIATYLERDVVRVTDHVRADLDRLFAHRRHRPVLDRLRCRQRAQEVAEIVGERVKLKANHFATQRETPS
jgi:hypothetical protein